MSNAVAALSAQEVQAIRQDFPILDLQVNHKPLVFLDNAASSQMPSAVMSRWQHYHSAQHANIHRAVHYLSDFGVCQRPFGEPTKHKAPFFFLFLAPVSCCRLRLRPLPPVPLNIVEA
jgi:hypothetical protein